MGYYLRRLIAFGAQVGVCQVESSGKCSVNCAGSQSEAEADYTVLFFYPRRGTSEYLREGRSRKFGIVASAVNFAYKRLDEYGHLFSAPLYSVLALVLTRRRVVSRRVDVLYRRFQFFPFGFSAAAVRGEARRVLSGKR